MSPSRPGLTAFSMLIGIGVWLAGCAALPFVLGFGGAVTVKAGETVAFPKVSSAILARERSDVRRVVFEILSAFGVPKAMVQEREGSIEAIEASIDGRPILVTLSPALDGSATRVTVRAQSNWLQVDEALQAALLKAITDKLKAVPRAGSGSA